MPVQHSRWHRKTRHPHRGTSAHMSTPDDETAKAQLGKLLKIAREDSQHRTQADLARAVQLERTGITRAENGEHPPTLQVLTAILEQTGPHSRLCQAAVKALWRLAR